MFKKKQLNVNIKDLDLQIGKLNKELEEMEKDSKYEATMDKLKNLAEIRVNLAKGLKDGEKASPAMLELDKQIEELTKMMVYLGRDEKYSDKLAKLEELTKIRCQLAESKVKASVKPAVVTGLFGMASMVVVLKYEQAEVITSKAFGMATSMFKGSK